MCMSTFIRITNNCNWNRCIVHTSWAHYIQRISLKCIHNNNAVEDCVRVSTETRRLERNISCEVAYNWLCWLLGGVIHLECVKMCECASKYTYCTFRAFVPWHLLSLALCIAMFTYVTTSHIQRVMSVDLGSVTWQLLPIYYAMIHTVPYYIASYIIPNTNTKCIRLCLMISIDRICICSRYIYCYLLLYSKW